MDNLYRRFQGRGKDSLLHRNLRMCTEEGVFATPFVILAIPGNVFIANFLTVVLGINASLYGWIVSLPAWANALQILLVPLLSRRYSARALSIAFALANLLIWLLLLLSLRRLPVDDPQAVGQIMILYFAFISLTQSVAGVSWMSWVREWVPDRLRGKYFGNRNRIMGLVTVGFILIVDIIFRQFGESMLAFEIILVFTGVLRLLTVYATTHIYTPWSRPEKMIHEGWTLGFRKAMRPGPFRSYLIFAAVQAFCLSLAGPFAPVFMSEHLDFSVSHQTHLLIISNLASALAMPLWGRLFDRYGCRPIIILTGLAWMAANFPWAFLTPQTTWLLYPMWIWGGIFSGGVILGGFNLVLKLIPDEMKSTGVSLHLAVTSVAAAFAPIIAGWVLTSAWIPLDGGDFRFRILLFVQPTLFILSLILLARVPEPKAAGLSSFSGSFRTMRQVLIQNGIFMAGNASFFRIIRRSVATVLTKKKAGETDFPDR